MEVIVTNVSQVGLFLTYLGDEINLLIQGLATSIDPKYQQDIPT